ncbi:MAG: alpha/beta hydrolase fold domain-containing protein [Propionibacteriales bacterium]|nr:alpha/beta hydrolase fold domain-containing protein [Propionibacteriales bacterium]
MTDIVQKLEAAWRRAEGPALRAALALPDRALTVVTGRRVVSQGQTLDPEMRAMLQLERLAREPKIEDLPLPAGRAAVVRQAITAGGKHKIGEVRDVVVAEGQGTRLGARLSARLYVPRDAAPTTALLMFVHGGGFVYGSLDSHDAPCRYLAERAGVRVLSVEYRLAPEHPYPAGLDDVVTAYRYLLGHTAELGADPERIAVGGDSAGGNLSAALCLRAREEGLPQPRLQVLVYPGTDFSQELPSRLEYAEGFYMTKAMIDRCRAAYLPDGADPTDPFLSPLQAKDLSGLAPAHVATAGFDPLRDEGEAYARRLSDDGVQVEMTRHPGLIHGFLNMVGVSSAARSAADGIVAQLRHRL